MLFARLSRFEADLYFVVHEVEYLIVLRLSKFSSCCLTNFNFLADISILAFQPRNVFAKECDILPPAGNTIFSN
jgi:hypothetical protein